MSRTMEIPGYRHDTEDDSSEPVGTTNKPICVLPDDEKQTYLSFCSM